MAAALLAVVVGVMPQFLIASMANEIDHSFAFSRELLGVSVALFNLVGVVLAPAMGRILARIGVQATLRLSAAVAGVASFAIATLVSSAWQLVVLLMIAGVSNGAAGPTASALLHRAVADQRHGLAFGTQQAGAPSALLLAGLAVPLVAVPFGWRWGFVGLAAIALAAAICAPPTAQETSRPHRASRPRISRYQRSVLMLVVLAAAAASAVGVGVVSFLVIFATHAGISESAAGLLLGAVSAGGIIGRIFFGLRVDRGRAKAVSSAMALFVACTAAVILFIVGTPAAIVVGALMMGGLGWAWNGVLVLAVVRGIEDNPVWAVGMLMSGVFAGSIVGPILVGFLSSQFSFRVAWSVCALVSVLPPAALGWARRRARARQRCRRDGCPAWPIGCRSRCPRAHLTFDRRVAPVLSR